LCVHQKKPMKTGALPHQKKFVSVVFRQNRTETRETATCGKLAEFVRRVVPRFQLSATADRRIIFQLEGEGFNFIECEFPARLRHLPAYTPQRPVNNVRPIPSYPF